MKCPKCLKDAAVFLPLLVDLKASHQPSTTSTNPAPRLLPISLCITCSYEITRGASKFVYDATSPRTDYPLFRDFVSTLDKSTPAL